jgi:hypothetical protein
MLTAIALVNTAVLLAGRPARVGVLDSDWLITPVRTPATVEKEADGNELTLTNGLISRRFRLKPNAATTTIS